MQTCLAIGTILTIIGVVSVSYSSYIRSVVKRFLRIQIRKYITDRYAKPSDHDAFTIYFRNALVNIQKSNNQLLKTILNNNRSCTLLSNHSLSFLSSNTLSSLSTDDHSFVDEFRQKVPLTTYDDYRHLIDRMIDDGETHLITANKIVLYAASSGTTGRPKRIPVSTTSLKHTMMIFQVAVAAVWRSFPLSSYFAAHQRQFALSSGKKCNLFSKSKDGTPIGPLSQFMSAVSFPPGMKYIVTSNGTMSIDLIECISDYETSTFVQLVFALIIPDIASYSASFASGLLHSIKLIENYFDEMCHCISTLNFNHSTLVRKKIHDEKVIRNLNRALEETAIEYGGLSYRLERACHIRKECLKKNMPGLLHRLWPQLVFVATAIGSTFAMYKKEVEFYCGERLPIINCIIYISSEGTFGFLASIHTSEYFLSPMSAFFEFIKEEDIHKTQPRTLLLSEVEPGCRYEIVCTTDSGLIRYRLGDVVTCTRFILQADGTVPLPCQKSEIPRIPLFSVAYRVGNLINLTGENTSEQHVMDALQKTVHIWRKQDIFVEICDFTLCPKLDSFPSGYVLFIEFKADDRLPEQLQRIFRTDALSEIERQLCEVNQIYGDHRNVGRIGSLTCTLVRNGTFSIFLNNILITDHVSPVQVKPHRLLKNQQHIQFFYDNRIDSSSLKA